MRAHMHTFISQILSFSTSGEYHLEQAIFIILTRILFSGTLKLEKRERRMQCKS
jgi:hypothetical protein